MPSPREQPRRRGLSRRRRLGLVTIGEAPRADLARPFLRACQEREAVAAGWKRPELVEAGALDGASAGEIARLGPGAGEAFYVTRIASGDVVKVSPSALAPRLARAIERLRETGADLVVLACTGTFRELIPRPEEAATAATLLVEPDALVKQAVAAMAPRRLAVVVPDEDQREQITREWRRYLPGTVVGGITLTPYDPPSGEVQKVVRAANQQHADLIVFDCMAYDEESLWEVASEVATVPMLVSAAVTARIVASMM